MRLRVNMIIKLYKYLFLTAIFLIPFRFRIFPENIFFYQISLSDIIFLLLFLILPFTIKTIDYKKFFSLKSFPIFNICFFFAIFFSAIFNFNITLLLWIYLIFCIDFLTFYFFNKLENAWHLIIETFYYSIIILCIFNLMSFIISFKIKNLFSLSYRLGIIPDNPNMLSFFCGILIIIIFEQNERSKFTAILPLFILYLTKSKTTILFCIFYFLYLFFFKSKKFQAFTKRNFFLFLFIIAILLFFFYHKLLFDNVRYKMFLFNLNSFNDKFMAQNNIFSKIYLILFGRGTDSIYSLDIFSKTFFETGIAGFALLCCIIISNFILLKKLKFPKILTILFLFFIFFGFGHYSLKINLLWILLSIIWRSEKIFTANKANINKFHY